MLLGTGSTDMASEVREDPSRAHEGQITERVMRAMASRWNSFCRTRRGIIELIDQQHCLVQLNRISTRTVHPTGSWVLIAEFILTRLSTRAGYEG